MSVEENLFILGLHKRIAELEASLQDAIRVLERVTAYTLCPICGLVANQHGFACNVPKWKALVKRDWKESEHE